MIVSDVNLVVYLLVSTPQTVHADRVLQRDRRWLVPHGFRLEFANAMRGFVKFRGMSVAHANALFEKARELTRLEPPEPPTEAMLLDVAHRSGLTVYDAEYLLLAQSRGVRLVTADKEILAAAPDVAVSIEDFADGK